MRKLLIALMLLTCIAGFAVAQDANLMNYIQLNSAVTSVAITNAAVSVAAYKGNGVFAAQFSPSTLASTSTVTLVTSATSGGTYVPVTNLAGTACVITQTGPATNDIQTVQIDTARLNAFVKTIIAQSGDTNSINSFLVAPMKSQ